MSITDVSAPPAAEEPKAVSTQTTTADPDDPGDDTTDATPAPAAGATDVAGAEPDKAAASQIAAEVIAKRAPTGLAALVREKKQLEAEKAKYKERDADLQAVAEYRRIHEVDPAAAYEFWLEHIEGKEKARSVLATSYDGLTQRILGSESKAAAIPPRIERSVSRAEKDLRSAQARIDALEAQLAEKAAAEQASLIQGAKEQLGGFLSEVEQEFPYLMAEADDPTEVVWGIMDEAREKGIELTVGEAAALANDTYKPAFEKKAPRYQNLLAPVKAGGTPSKPEAAKSANGTPRRSLTNADASQTTTDTTLPPPKNDQERAERSWRLLKERAGQKG